MDQILAVCRQRGASYGLEFNELTYLCNSRLALETAEFARDHGAYHPVHHGVFEAYFTRGEDIGDRAVLRRVVAEHGLDPDELDKTLDQGRYAVRVNQGSREATSRGVTAIPSFFIEDRPVITGAVHEDIFRAELKRARSD